ncbi:MAG: TetR/AcrR family transcriptional regulator [Acidobacteria bacterium]|nr:TetR/AcrR family transcriptional regulator [Acidobacteriota bacterium]
MPQSSDVRTSSREMKREKILRAAIEVFAKRGYFSSRMTDVAHRANVADGTLYLYFDGKEDLLQSIFDHVLTLFIERVQDEVEVVEDPVEKLRLLIRRHLELLGGDPALAQVLQIEIRHSRRFLALATRGKLGEYLNLIRGIIEEGQSLGRFRHDISAGLATQMVFGSVDELVMSWVLQDSAVELESKADPLMALLTDGLVPR